ncbi:hypothetical protein GPALN_003063 [Globodera pallida]|nr:hypothetical protein GPALN_003063 [Globodera pallida]
MYGSHVIQKALKSVDKALQIEIIEELTPRLCVIKCIKDQYGSSVMGTIIELIEPQRLQFVVDAILSSPSDSVASLSLHEYGNLVIQRVLEHCTEQQKRPLLEQLLGNVPTLVTDQYGSFVIRHVLEHGLPEDREPIVRSLHENVLTLVTDKYGSFVIRHVIEHGLPEDRERIVRSLHGDIMKNTHLHSFCDVIIKCLVFGTTEQKNALIDQVCADNGSGQPPLLQMMKQQFAKDVVQKMLNVADSARRQKMMFVIKTAPIQNTAIRASE